MTTPVVGPITQVATLETSCREFRIWQSALDPGVPLGWLEGPLRASGIDLAEYRDALAAVAGPWRLAFAEAARCYPGVRVLLSEQLHVTDEMLANFPDAEALVVFRRRVDPADRARYESAGLRVAPVARYTSDSVADHVLAMVLTHARNLHGAALILPGRGLPEPGGPAGDGSHNVSLPNWNSARKPVRLAGLRLGVLGAGEIGVEVLRRAAAFGMQLGYADLKPRCDVEKSLGARRFDMYELAAWADVVSLHLPEASSTKGIVDGKFLDLLGPDGLLVNTSRGSLVDHESLTEALRAHRLAGACLDVLPSEPLLSDDPIVTCPNVMLTGHVAGGGWWGVLDDLSQLASAVSGVLRGHQL